MGNPMVISLAKAGFQLLVHDRSRDAWPRLAADAAAAGVPKSSLRNAGSPREIAEAHGVTAVVSMLPETTHVRDVYEGPDGLLAARGGLLPRLLIDMSTISPTYTRSLAQLVRRVKCRPNESDSLGGRSSPLFMDCPVSGGVPGAANASLTFMCGGPDRALHAARPLLGAMGLNVIHLGLQPGLGQVAKLCNNLACAVEMAAVSEALALGCAAGLDPRTLSLVLNVSTGRCWASDSYNPVPNVMPGVPSSEGYRGGFNSSLMLKDLRLALELAGAVEQPAPMAASAAPMYARVTQVAAQQQQQEASPDDPPPPPPDFSAIYKIVYGGRDASPLPGPEHLS